MKLIIDIPEEEYFVIKHYGDIPLNKTYFTAMSIINGIPLDKIKDRIILEKLGWEPSAGYYIAIDKVLQIIDKYKAESEVEKNDEN